MEGGCITLGIVTEVEAVPEVFPEVLPVVPLVLPVRVGPACSSGPGVELRGVGRSDVRE